MEKIYEEIYKMHSQRIIRVGTASRPVLVVFSAIPGSGKSELTKRLVKDYGFLSVANKDICWAIEETGHSNDAVIGNYTSWLLDKLTKEKSKSIVFDRNIDQWYEPSKAWAYKNSYQYAVVRIEVSPQKLNKRLLNREGSSTAEVFNVLDFYSEQHKQMSKVIKAEMELKDDYDLEDAALRITNMPSTDPH